MTVYTLTLTALRTSPSGTDTKSLRAAFNDEWQKIEPVVRAVPGVEVLRVGRFGATLKADDDARQKLEALLPQSWELQLPPPPATPFAQGPQR